MNIKAMEMEILENISKDREDKLLALDNANTDRKRPKLLLHSCCGPCSTACIERLTGNYDITVFFYNPNVTDKEEYLKRRDAQIKFIDEYNITLENDKIYYLEGEYNPEEYFALVKDYANEPEGGKRCTLCFEMRLERAAMTAKLRGDDMFATTLTVSPHKNYKLVSEIGNRLGLKYGMDFLDIDFKKKAGFQRSIQLSKDYELYRQNYCGCHYSKR